MLTRWYAKSFKLGCSSTWTENFPMYKLGLEKAEGPEIKLSTFTGSWRKQGNFRKTCNLCFTDYTKAFVQITTNCGKFWEMGIPDHLLLSWETCTGLKKQQLEPDMEQRTGSILGKEYIKVVYSHHEKSCARWITSWHQDCWEKYQQPQIGRWYHSYGRKWRGTKESLDESEKLA